MHKCGAGQPDPSHNAAGRALEVLSAYCSLQAEVPGEAHTINSVHVSHTARAQLLEGFQRLPKRKHGLAQSAEALTNVVCEILSRDIRSANQLNMHAEPTDGDTIYHLTLLGSLDVQYTVRGGIVNVTSVDSLM